MKGLFSGLTQSCAAVIERVQSSLVVLRTGGHGFGAGIIWRPDGLVVTNNHVVGDQGIALPSHVVGELSRNRLGDASS